MTARRKWWGVFAAGAAAVVVGLVWMSAVVLRLEREGREAAARARHEESLRLALWRMDSWLGPLLARESARPYYVYDAFYTPRGSYSREHTRVAAGEVLTASPLLDASSELLPLYFQWRPGAGCTSPQVPMGEHLLLASEFGIDLRHLDRRADWLDRLEAVLDVDRVLSELAGTDGAEEEAVPPTAPEPAEPEVLRSLRELTQRDAAGAHCALPEPGAGSGTDAEVGPFVPLWLPSGPTAISETFLFVRRFELEHEVGLQGFLVDWPRLRAGLISQTTDLLDGAELTPIGDRVAPATAEPHRLATLPVVVGALPPPLAGDGPSSATRAQLALVWLGAIVAIGAVGFTLRASIEFGERRSRFASAVTHELRTPLTTFRIYSEMLADGMIDDPARVQEYLETLKTESERLTALVENVLGYARLEEGRHGRQPERIRLDALVERIEPPLRRQAERVDAALSVRAAADHPDAVVDVDPELVGQVLFNLVDNAFKYGRNGHQAEVDVAVSIDGRDLVAEVRDHGPGVPSELRRSLFDPFARGEGTTSTPGTGLGLALARGLARGAGGELVLVDGDTARPGARFRLTLPSASATPAGAAVTDRGRRSPAT